MSEKIPVSEVIVVEGRYDKNTLKQIFDAVIIETNGFGIMNDSEKMALLQRLARERGLVIFTDSDGAGFLIRSKIKGAVDGKYLKHAYIPDVYGKERRKSSPSCEGKIGVEGMEREVLISALRASGAHMGDEVKARKAREITKADLMALGLSGVENCEARRQALMKELSLPERLSPNALLDVLNALYTLEDIERIVGEINRRDG